MSPREFRHESLRAILAHVAEGAARGEAVELRVLDPDRGAGHHAGEVIDGRVHRPWRVWLELADRLGLRLCTPRVVEHDVIVRFEPLQRAAVPVGGAGTEKYGAASDFARISKLEDPGFVIDLREALARVQLAPTARVLDLGVNTGDELELVYEAAPRAEIVGIDHAESALAVARTRFAQARFHVADLATLPALGLGRFALVVSIGTLQSPGVDDRNVLRELVQDHLAPGGAVILGVPNCRYVDGEVIHGTRMRNFAQPELGLVIKDIAFYRKYLQQHRMQVFVTGRNYLLVTAVPS